MTDYQSVTAAMNAGTPHEVICGTCPWDRLCVSPPTMSSSDVQQAITKAGTPSSSTPMEPGQRTDVASALIATMMFAGKDTSGALCPVFSTRLRADRKVADGIRAMMQATDAVSA